MYIYINTYIKIYNVMVSMLSVHVKDIIFDPEGIKLYRCLYNLQFVRISLK